jgi:hypothetical protein
MTIIPKGDEENIIIQIDNDSCLVWYAMTQRSYIFKGGSMISVSLSYGQHVQAQPLDFLMLRGTTLMNDLLTSGFIG